MPDSIGGTPYGRLDGTVGSQEDEKGYCSISIIDFLRSVSAKYDSTFLAMVCA